MIEQEAVEQSRWSQQTGNSGQPESRNPTTGLIAALFGCFFGLISIFIFALVFVPLSLICSLIGLLRSTSFSTVGVSILGFVLAAIGFMTSPTLLFLAGLTTLFASAPSSAPKTSYKPPPKSAIISAPTQVDQKAETRSKIDRQIEQPPPILPSKPLAENPKPDTMKPYMMPAPVQLGTHWVEVTRSMFACGNVDDRPELKQKAFQAIVAWQTKTTLPQGCFWLKVGDRYLVDAQQTVGEQQQIVKLWEINCPSGCSPFASPIYVPPWTIVGPCLRPSQAPQHLRD